MIPSQMLKGTLEGCVLAVLREEEHYGYEISQRLESYGFGGYRRGRYIRCCSGLKNAGPS